VTQAVVPNLVREKVAARFQADVSPTITLCATLIPSQVRDDGMSEGVARAALPR
jgi:hypothetical protein